MEETIPTVDRVADVNCDLEVPEDEEEDDRLPRKQKFKMQKDVCDMNNYDKLPEQEPESFVWSNKHGQSKTWTTRKPNSELNP